jgi:hypothetical protein
LDNGALPSAQTEWNKQSSARFKAGTHGPVRLPVLPELTDKLASLPETHVLIPRNCIANFTTGISHIPPEHADFLNKKTDDEVRTGSVQPVTSWSQVRILCPVFVVVQESTGKLRVIYDARALNALLADASGSVKYESLRDAMLLRAQVATKLDLQSAFRHVRLHEEHAPLLGFVVNGKVYRYSCLPFGVSWSPALYAKMLQPAINAIRRLGIKIIWYVDDLLIVANNREELDAALTRVMQELAGHGWKVASDKTFCYAYSTIPFLGLLVTMSPDGARLSVPRDKRDKIIIDIMSGITTGMTSVHTLQKLTGRLAFIRIVITELGFARSSLDGAIASAARHGNSAIPVIGRLRDDMAWLLAHLSDDRILERRAFHRFDHLRRHILYSDASAFGWGVLLVDTAGPFRAPPGCPSAQGWSRSGSFSAYEMSLSSGAREIRAILAGIIALGLRDATLSWHSDSTVAVAAVDKWASSAAGVAEALGELFAEVQSRNLSIEIIHVRRDLELMPVADWLSRRGWRDRQAEWAFAQSDALTVCRALKVAGCSGDLFASSNNHLFGDVFCSRFLEVGSRGDAMVQPWWNRTWWAFPPLSLRSRVLLRLASYIRMSIADDLTIPASKSRQRRHLNMILVIVPVQASDPDAQLWEEVSRIVRSSVVVSHPDPATATVLPQFRLIGDRGRPAPRAPPWPLTAYHLHIARRT